MIKVRRLLFYAFAAAALVFCFESTKGMAAQTDIRCEHDGNGTMLVHGNGVLQWTAIEESTEDEVGYGIKKVVIQEGITEISAGCFSGDFTDMMELKLPNSLQKIGNRAFKGCKKLKKVVLPLFDVRYSKRRDMANAKYFRIMDAPKVIHGLKKNQRYYFEIAYVETEDDDDDYESIWVGRRNIVIRK